MKGDCRRFDCALGLDIICENRLFIAGLADEGSVEVLEPEFAANKLGRKI